MGHRPAEQHGQRLIDYYGPPRTIPTVSLYQALAPREYLPPGFFQDKIVFVGGTSSREIGDVVEVPKGEMMGAHMQMCALAAARHGDFYRTASKAGIMAAVLLMAIVAFSVFLLVNGRLLVGLGALAGCGAAYLLVVRVVYFSFDSLLPSFAPTATLGVAGILCFGSQFVIVHRAKRTE